MAADQLNRQRLADLKELFFQHHGGVGVELALAYPGRGEVRVQAGSDLGVRPNRGLFKTIRERYGETSVALAMREPEIAPRKNARWKRAEG